MVTKIIDLEQEPSSLDTLLNQLKSDTEILLMRGDTPLARIVLEAKPNIAERTPGLHAGTTWVSDDFDEPLGDSFWLGDE